MTEPVRTHNYAGVLLKGDHPDNERCFECGYPRLNRRHLVSPVPAEVMEAERARYAEREDD